MFVPDHDTFKELTLLFVEDELLLRTAMEEFLAPFFRHVVCATNGREALDLFPRLKPDLVLTDIIMPVMDGIVLTEQLGKLSPETPVVLYSAFTEVPYLLRGIELGVAGFVPKPSEDTKLLSVLGKAALPVLQKRRLQGLETELCQSLQQMLGRGPAMKDLAKQVQRIARTSYSLLIQGETGTGKSRLASIVHGLSQRANSPFITVQIGSIPESLIAAELFGHEKGAYTGAERKREGLVSTADKGTLFLDDIDAAPASVQALLLRLVEEKCYYSLGSNRRIDVDVRILAASNRNLADDVAAGRFRQDLYYRLAGLLVTLPPLRSIPGDLPDLASQFLIESCREIDCEPFSLDAEQLAVLAGHPWPGNIRELRNLIRRAVVMADSKLTPELLRSLLHPVDSSPPPQSETAELAALPLAMGAVEQWALQRALHVAGGKKMQAARLLEMNYYTFRRRCAHFGLEGEDA